jgi:hypothetical protein
MAKTIFLMRCTATKMAFVPGLLDEIPVLLCIVHVVAVRNEVAEVFGVFVTFAFLTVFGVF